MSREKILNAVEQSLPEQSVLPTDLKFAELSTTELKEKFIATLSIVGGRAVEISQLSEIEKHIPEHYKESDRVICTVPGLKYFTEVDSQVNPHEYYNVELSIIKGHFAVAENAAIWVTEDLMGHRVLPFICQHLAIVIDADKIVGDLHAAYQYIANLEIDYGFATFIAGPSKTADIEQSLVLGAHGPRSLTVFVLNSLN